MKKNNICIFAALSAAGVSLYVARRTHCRLKDSQAQKDRYAAYYQIASQWVQNLLAGRNIGAYFQKRNIQSIAVYGLGSLASLFLQNLESSNVEVAFIIDKNHGAGHHGSVPVLESFQDGADIQADAIVVTPVYDFQAIRQELQSQGAVVPILSIEDVICDCEP